MNDTWITNTSPIISLAKIDQLSLLTTMCRELLVPQPVVAEILDGPLSDPARQIFEHGWGIIVSPQDVPTELVEWGLGPGETAVLAVALERNSATVVLDDSAARTCAKTMRIEVIGTLGVVLRAKRKGIIPSATDVLESLIAAGLHLDQKVVASALQGIGETWRQPTTESEKPKMQ